MFDRFRSRLARLISAPKVGTRLYATAKQSRLTEGFGVSTTSADSELISSLPTLRARSRQLIRDAAYAKRAKVVVQNNVIGSGIGLQAQVMTERGSLSERINSNIEAAFAEWARADNCHTGGGLHFSDFERAAIGQVFEAGEAFIRKHPVAVGSSKVPLALELIEAERLVETIQPGAQVQGAVVRMGIEVDSYHRPIAYWFRSIHPGELQLHPQSLDRYERVPADQIIHLRVIDRWPQTRGEPWLHAVARKLNDMDGYSEAEIIAARGAASYMATIESPDEAPEKDATGAPQMTIEPGMVQRLANGETLNFVSPNRPNSAVDPFMRMMLREVAAGVGVSYESLSRDYSQSNYSSSRLALLDDRDLWKVLQQWFIRSFREPLHREWLRQAVLSRAIDGISVLEYASAQEKFEAVRFKPRGWSWVDPTKEVNAYKEAVLAGFITVSDVIAQTGAGRDIEDVLNERERELALMEEKGLKFDTEFKEPKPAPAPPPPPAEPDDDEPEAETETDNAERIARAVGNAIADTVRSLKAPQALVTVEQPVVNIAPPAFNLKSGDIHIQPPAITVNTPEVRIDNQVDIPETVVHVAAPDVRIDNQVDVPATVVNIPETVVHVAAPDVRIDNHVDVPRIQETEQSIERDDRGEIRTLRTRTVR